MYAVTERKKMVSVKCPTDDGGLNGMDLNGVQPRGLCGSRFFSSS